MYSLSSVVDIEFVIPINSSVVLADYDLAILWPVTGRIYYESALTSFIAPFTDGDGVDQQGKGTYNLLLSEAGRYRFTLSTGVEGAYQELSQIEIFVVDKANISAAITNSIQTTVICPVVETSLGS